MVSTSENHIRQLRDLIEEAVAENIELATSLKILHQGNLDATLERFLKARDNNVQKAYKMLMDCLHWRVVNDIDGILSKPIEPKETYDAIRETHLVGLTGFCKKGRPVFALGVGLSGFDKAPVDKYVQSHIQLNEYRDRILLPQSSKKMGRFLGTCLKILDMSNLKLTALSRIKILTLISTVDDMNYPEKTDTYYIVNVPYIFSACWKAVKPLLHERTKLKVCILQGSGRDELLKIMDPDVLPHFCKYESRNSGSSKGSKPLDCFSPSHSFHTEVWNYIKQQAYVSKCVGPLPQMSFHVKIPDPDEEVHTIETAIKSALVQFAGEDGRMVEPSCSFTALHMDD